ncbi:MAG: DNA-directed RNA polymerase subunit omega [Candidatus Omnitrophota bacterium]
MIDSPILSNKSLKAGQGSLYKLTILAARRAISLANGEKPLIDKPVERALDNALQEIIEGKIRVKKAK